MNAFNSCLYSNIIGMPRCLNVCVKILIQLSFVRVSYENRYHLTKSLIEKRKFHNACVYIMRIQKC